LTNDETDLAISSMGFYSQEGEFTPNIESLPLSHTHTGEKMQVESRMSIKETQRITKKKCLWGVWDTREVNIKSLWD
jgi:hypothetical protein